MEPERPPHQASPNGSLCEPDALTLPIQRHYSRRRAVFSLIFWIGLTGFFIPFVLQFTGRIQSTLSGMKGAPSEIVRENVVKNFSTALAFPTAIVWDAKGLPPDQADAAWKNALDAVRADEKVDDVTDGNAMIENWPRSDWHAAFVASKASTYGEAEKVVPRLRKIVAQLSFPGGVRPWVTGGPALFLDLNLASTKSLRSGELIALPAQRKIPQRDQWITIRGARGNNLRNVTVALPVGLLTCVTGVSGSGKSTLVDDTLFRHAAAQLNDASPDGAGPCDEIDGLKRFERVIEIDQNPIGRTPRSNPATYTGLFTIIRELFAAVPEARARGYDAGRFSFNVKGGRCEACQGDGVIRVEMHFLPDVYVPCDICRGQRYNRETLEIQYRGRNVHQVLDTTVEDALKLFEHLPAAAVKLRTLVEVGLSYVRLGQNATTLSGGEAQRVKLARELAKRGTGRTLYILDEPTTGLHFHDIAQLLHVLQQLRDAGNTLVVIEHNLDVIKTADYVIDLGPEGGDRGGRVVAAGTPEQICEVPESITGQYLAPLLADARAPRAHALTVA